MQVPLIEMLRPWRDFYALIGTAAATLVGLMFVVASIGTGVFTSAHQAGTRSFLSPTVVHFSAVLMICLLAIAPAETWLSLGTLLSVAGLVGSAYSGWIWRRMTKHGFWVTIDMADRLWYTMLPIVVYLVVTGAGFGLAQQKQDGLNVLAVGVILLLIIGIRNAWDMTVWTMHRHQN